MDMSVGDFLAIFYLLKVPVEEIYLKAILVTGSGWANAATIDVSYPNDPNLGDCKYSKAIPHGNGGRLDSDTLYGFARDLPRSPRRYAAVNSSQPLALDVWRSLVKSINDGSRIPFLANGPLTNLGNILLSDNNSSSIIKEVFILGGHTNYENNQDKGNVFNVRSNKYAELNMFLDPLSAKTIFD
ncbi:nucleoside hydrolase 4-like [Bidens hawaiensis]|uniref:nucleoside hydrolase 4-like n=1 Tax=Bidens hawaiensis TaxID=980011 RepID=UPI0040495C7A